MNRSEMSPFARALYTVAKTVVTWWIALLHPQRVQGRENLPADGSFIVIANHRSMLDVFFIARLLLPRRTVFMQWPPALAHRRSRRVSGQAGLGRHQRGEEVSRRPARRTPGLRHLPRRHPQQEH